METQEEFRPPFMVVSGPAMIGMDVPPSPAAGMPALITAAHISLVLGHLVDRKVHHWASEDRRRIYDSAKAELYRRPDALFGDGEIEACVNRIICQILRPRHERQAKAHAEAGPVPIDLEAAYRIYMPWIQGWVRTNIPDFPFTDQEDVANKAFLAFIEVVRSGKWRGEREDKSIGKFTRNVAKRHCFKCIQEAVEERRLFTHDPTRKPKEESKEVNVRRGDWKRGGFFDDSEAADEWLAGLDSLKVEPISESAHYGRHIEASTERRELARRVLGSLPPDERLVLFAWANAGRAWLDEWEPVTEVAQGMKPTRNQVKKVLEGARRDFASRVKKLGYKQKKLRSGKMSDYF